MLRADGLMRRSPITLLHDLGRFGSLLHRADAHSKITVSCVFSVKYSVPVMIWYLLPHREQPDEAALVCIQDANNRQESPFKTVLVAHSSEQ